VRTALFWVLTQPVVAISYRRFGTAYRSYLQESETSVRNCHYSLRNKNNAVILYFAMEARSHHSTGRFIMYSGITKFITGKP